MDHTFKEPTGTMAPWQTSSGPRNQRRFGRWVAVAALMVIGAVVPVGTQASAKPENVDPSLSDPTDVRVVGLDSTLHVTWTPAEHPDAAWQLMTVWDGDTLQQSKVASKTATVVQANGVTPGKAYTVTLQTMAADGRLSPGATIAATVDPQPPMPNAAFFDNFNGAHGLLDGDKYDVRTTVAAFEDGNNAEPNRLDLRRVFNSEQHFHTQLINAAGKGGIIIRPRVPFDFSRPHRDFSIRNGLPAHPDDPRQMDGSRTVEHHPRQRGGVG